MKRKVIKQGNNTLTITLPRKWAEHTGIKAGDELSIEERGNSLLIGTEKEGEERMVVIDTTKLGFLHKNYISYLYQIGYSQIKILFSEKKTFNFIQEKVGECIGFEIVDHGENYCIIKNVASGLHEEFDTMLRRMFLMLLSFVSSSLDAVKKRQFERLQEIALLDRSIDKFSDFCLRILVTKGYKDYSRTPFMYAFIRDLEKVSHVYRRLCDYLYENGGRLKISKETISLYEEINIYLRNLYEMFYRYDKKRALTLMQEEENITKRINELFRILPREESIVIHHLLVVSREIYYLAGPFFRTVL